MAGKVGRPSAWNPQTEERFLQAVVAGNYIETAAAYAGLDKATLYRRLKRGRKAASGADHEFTQRVEQALAQAETRDVALIGKAAQEDWKAAAWRLERKNPTRWGRRDTVTVLQQVRDEVKQLSDDELVGLLGAGDADEDSAGGGAA